MGKSDVASKQTKQGAVIAFFDAIAAWLTRRFGLAEREIFPNGFKERRGLDEKVR